MFVIGDDGQFLFVSDNVSQYLGLMPVSIPEVKLLLTFHYCMQCTNFVFWHTLQQTNIRTKKFIKFSDSST